MSLAARIGPIAAARPIDEAPPELPQLIEGLQGWISTTKGRFLFGDGSSTPGHGKAVHEARNVSGQTALFSQATAGLRPTWDATTFDVPCIRSNGSQYLTRNTALAAPGLVIVGCAFDSGSTGFRCLTAARSTATPGGDPSEEAWHLNKANTDQMRGVVATDTGIHFADTPIVSGEKLLVMMEVVGSTLQVWQIGSTGEETISGTRIVADGEQALLAKYYNDVITSILEGAIFEFAQYAPAPSRELRRLLVHYFQGLIWPTVAPPLAANVDAGQIEQGATRSVDVISPSSGSSLVLASIDEQPDVGSLSTSGDNVVVNVPPGAALGQYNGQYCLRSDMADARLVDFGRVDFEVIEAAGGAATLPEDEPLPTPLNTVAGTTGNFDSLLGSSGTASPGDRITLANGSYGTKTIAVSGTSANPIQVVATNLLQPTFTSLVITGAWVIISGVTVDPGSAVGSGVTLDINASNVRVTRCKVTNGARTVAFRSGVTDILVDHCEISRSRVGSLDTPGSITQRRITVARCWIHSLIDPGTGVPSHAFLFAGANTAREQPVDYICRFNYVTGIPSRGIHHFSHNKVSTCCLAFNRLDGGQLFVHRFGLRGRYIGNYAPNSNLRAYDDLHWIYGNSQNNIQGPAGRSGYQNDEKNLPISVGGFHAFKRARLSGNTAPIVLGSTLGSNFCTGSGAHPQTLPDPIAAGMIKPQRTFNGITYAADDPDDPDTGIKIRAQSGSVTTNTDACVNLPGGYVQNLDSQPGSAAPASWLTDLFAEYPWIESICPDPTSLTGGSGGSAPWSIAQALTRGDAGSPNTGPFRASPGGLP